MSLLKKLGHCSGCGDRLWDSGTPWGTQPGWFVDVWLADGTLMSLTFCDVCADQPDWDDVWESVLRSWLAEVDRVLSPAHKGAIVDYTAWHEQHNFILAESHRRRFSAVPEPLRGGPA